MEQADSKPMNPVVLGVAAAVLIAGLVSLAALGRLVLLPKSQGSQEARQPAARSVDAGDESGHRASRPEPGATTPLCATCGTVEAVRLFEVQGGDNAGVAVADNAPAGREIEKQAGRKTVYRVTIRMDDGSYRTISQPVAPGYGSGEKVRIIDGSVVPHG
jgi:outer membrane lipoprotein SlyB